MDIPDAYIEYAASFYPRLPEEVSSDDEFIARGLGFLTGDQFACLKAFLPEALAGGCSVAELQQAWMSAGPRFGFNDRDLPIFLQMTVRVMASGDLCSNRIPGRPGSA